MSSTHQFDANRQSGATEVSTSGAPDASARLQTAVRLVGVLLLAGVAVGVAWWQLAPPVLRNRVEGGISTPAEQVGRIFIGEGVLAALVLAAGVVSGLATHRLQRRAGPDVAVALAVGGLLASVLAWRVGTWLGPDDATAFAAAVGERVAAPLTLRATAILVLWPVASLAVSFVLAFASDPDRRSDPDPGPDPVEVGHAPLGQERQ